MHGGTSWRGSVESVGKWNPVAIRLRVLRRALFDDSATQFAKRLGITATRLRNLEKGYPLSIDVAIKIRAAVPGMTPDWLYHGEERSLPMEMVMRLRDEATKPEYLPPSGGDAVGDIE
jgi:plasmid maintenance system antidote protein VapI